MNKTVEIIQKDYTKFETDSNAQVFKYIESKYNKKINVPNKKRFGLPEDRFPKWELDLPFS